MPTDQERADQLEKLLLELGPLTHKLETVALPEMYRECRQLYAEGREAEAATLENRIDRAKAQIKVNNDKLKEIERELYPLRSKLARRHDREPT